MKHWYVVKHYVCELMEENCEDRICDRYNASEAPNCDECSVVKEWKESGLTKEKFIKHNITDDERSITRLVDINDLPLCQIRS